MKAFPKDYVPTVFDNYNAVVMWDGRPVNLGLWDTAGQDDFEAMRPMSYMNADIFLIFFAIDNPVSFQNVKHKWYPEITKDDRDVPRILVGTKSDCRTHPETLKRLQEKKIKPISFRQGRKMAKEIGCISYIECSAITNKGFRDVFGQTVAGIMNLRNGKRPGHECWSTSCNINFTVFSKRSKCIRCQQYFCRDCVVLLPRTHNYGNKLICKKCRDIDLQEPLQRRDNRKKKKKGKKGEEEEESESSSETDSDDDYVPGEAVPMSKELLMASFCSTVNSVSATKAKFEPGGIHNPGEPEFVPRKTRKDENITDKGKQPAVDDSPY
eukprot:CAMPEP_0174260266 /NCGR_PEP_ID=MMETSP0439-20130205/9428_1 /TAXON_ID=0 /ORGANISM="Stereomyxa ramosa, Strain Chinc5" /LENGTH=324 /DNA_ID=CAMNT_0015344475 /DNA_START=267 /DNA_END=1239 /DNA_ORIENTATION=-